MTLRRDSRKKLGEMLAARGHVDRAVLLSALRSQRVNGGRLGTCLLELGAVAEDDLLHVLADQLRLPFFEADDLRLATEDALKLVPAKVAGARCAVPVRASGTQLSVAMLDPHDLGALDEIAFVSGRRIRPHAALEVRLQEALARSYGIDIPTRFVKLIDRLNRSRYMWKDESGAAATGSPAPAATVPPVLLPPGPASPYPPLPPRPGEAPAPAAIDHSAAWTPIEPASGAVPVVATVAPLAPQPPLPANSAPPQTAPPGPPEPRRSASILGRPRTSFEQTELRLRAPAERDDVADALVEFTRARADVALLLMVRREEAAGWRGLGIDAATVETLRIDLGEPSLVHALLDGAPLHRGPLTPLRGNGPLRAAIGEVGDLLALPIAVRQRIVAVCLVGSRGEPLSAELVEDLQRLASSASAALEQLVLRQKRQAR